MCGALLVLLIFHHYVVCLMSNGKNNLLHRFFDFNALRYFAFNSAYFAVKFFVRFKRRGRKVKIEFRKVKILEWVIVKYL